MPRTKGKAFDRGIEEGRQLALRFLSVSIDCWPGEPSEMTVDLLGVAEIDMSAVTTELQRFADKLDEAPRRRRRASAANAGDEEAVP